MAQWVSFQMLKRQVGIEDILSHYGLLERLRQKRDELVGLCPFHQETKGSFSASVTKNAFQCFGCNRKGNILGFNPHFPSVPQPFLGITVHPATWNG